MCIFYRLFVHKKNLLQIYSISSENMNAIIVSIGVSKNKVTLAVGTKIIIIVLKEVVTHKFSLKCIYKYISSFWERFSLLRTCKYYASSQSSSQMLPCFEIKNFRKRIKHTDRKKAHSYFLSGNQNLLNTCASAEVLAHFQVINNCVFACVLPLINCLLNCVQLI